MEGRNFSTILITQLYSVLFAPTIMSFVCVRFLHTRNLQSALNEGRAPSPSTVTLYSALSLSQKCQSKQLNSLGRWPTVVLLLSTLCIRNNGHPVKPVLLVPTSSVFKCSPVFGHHIRCGTHEGHRWSKGK